MLPESLGTLVNLEGGTKDRNVCFAPPRQLERVRSSDIGVKGIWWDQVCRWWLGWWAGILVAQGFYPPRLSFGGVVALAKWWNEYSSSNGPVGRHMMSSLPIVHLRWLFGLVVELSGGTRVGSPMSTELLSLDSKRILG